jgi:GT2 family glycosyltransferase
MLSIIVCSRNIELLKSLEKNIHESVGCIHELIIIDNSKNEYSIYSAYNEGVKKSKFPYLCFVHEDVEFLTSNWAEKVISHLNEPNTGLIGVAGGQAMLRVPLGWPSLNAYYNITHSIYNKKNLKIEEKTTYPEKSDNKPISVVLLDGLFLCAKRELFNQIKFDENFKGFHGYDLDICLQAIHKGFYNYVVYDIEMKHFSTGKFDINFVKTVIKIHEKWSQYLPIFEHSYSPESISKVLYKAERSSYYRLRKRLVRAGMTNEDIYPILKKSILLSGNKFDKFFFNFLPIQLNYIRLTSIMRGVMIYQKQKK